MMMVFIHYLNNFKESQIFKKLFVLVDIHLCGSRRVKVILFLIDDKFSIECYLLVIFPGINYSILFQMQL